MGRSIEQDVVRAVDAKENTKKKKIKVAMFKIVLANGPVGLAALLPVVKDLKFALDPVKAITAVKN